MYGHKQTRKKIISVLGSGRTWVKYVAPREKKSLYTYFTISLQNAFASAELVNIRLHKVFLDNPDLRRFNTNMATRQPRVLIRIEFLSQFFFFLKI